MGLFQGAFCRFALVRNSTTWRVSRTIATGLVWVIIAEQKVPMVWLKLTRVCVERQHLPHVLIRVQSCLRPTSKCKSRLQRSHFAGRRHCYLRRELRGQVECNSIAHSDMPLRRYTYADTGLPFPSCVTTTLLQRSDSTVTQTEKFDALDCTNSTVGETCVVGRYQLRACFWRHSNSAPRALPA